MRRGDTRGIDDPPTDRRAEALVQVDRICVRVQTVNTRWRLPVPQWQRSRADGDRPPHVRPPARVESGIDERYPLLNSKPESEERQQCAVKRWSTVMEFRAQRVVISWMSATVCTRMSAPTGSTERRVSGLHG